MSRPARWAWSASRTGHPGPSWQPYAKGAIFGFGDVHTRAHLYRAILEGIVFALKEGAQLTEKKNRVPITEIRATGGGSRSDSIVQMTADIFGLPVPRPHTHETSVLGAAMDAAVGLGVYPRCPHGRAGDDQTGPGVHARPQHPGFVP